MKKFMKWTGIVLGGLVVLVLLAGLVSYPIGLEKLNRTYAGIPAETVTLPTGPDAIALGKHVAIVWECTKCHGDDLSGKIQSDDAIFGTIPAANLTTGQGGIGQSYSDADWVRALRHGVKPNNHVEVSMYNFSTLSDRDLGALLAYLKHIPAVDSHLPALQIGALTAIAPALGLDLPAAAVIDHAAPRPADPTPGATKEYGQYLYAICLECHSKTLANKLGTWKQDDFLRAMQTGVLPNGKMIGAAMPLTTFGELTDTEVNAMWLYLQSLPAKSK